MPPISLASRLLFAVAWCLGRLPLSLHQRLGDALGRFAHWRDTREARVARRNLELVEPGLDAAAREAAVAGILRATGRNAFETLRIWTRPRADNLALVASVVGEPHLAAAMAAGRGLVLAAPHYGNLELVIEFMAARGPFALVYRVPDSRVGDGFLRLARGGENITLVPAEGNAMRPLWKALKAGGVVGITPDQQPKLGAGEFAPFFGRQALTLSLIPRLAERSGAAVLFAFAERREDGRFDLHFAPAEAALGGADIAAATAAMNAGVEAIARRDFRQYQWTYKRFTLRPPGSGEIDPYGPECR
ncbi:MAG TPA: lipid A biosynthesis lauroyl acyltransferase [Arenimonas sp.]|uniref:LpxL/LpxP family acyltransferase n=1 Tax=Arenimonas sp. TaxID=1872635 RepID=UPI002D7FBD66|nr:lipid A biosynthesis lauroyl acyltransferase [Arenimonas sp.]HEU0154100.1 lipid A biosynthesis lauroyl acyltransferase [Arenimonas sp.]